VGFFVWVCYNIGEGFRGPYRGLHRGPYLNINFFFMRIETVRKLGKNSRYSYDLCIPAHIVKALGFKERQKLVIVADTTRKRIIVTDWVPRRAKRKEK